MMRLQESRTYSEFNALKYMDKVLVGLYLAISIFGCMNIYSASITTDQATIFDFTCNSGKQIMWMGISLFAGIVVMFMKSNVFDQLAYVFYGFVILLLVATIFLSSDINGSRSWLVLGPVSLQPAEFAKLASVLAVAKMMSEYQFQLSDLRSYMKVVALFLLPMVIIVMQKETGSALVFASFILLLYREGMSGLIPLLAFLAVLLFVLTIKFSPFWSLLAIFITQIIFLIRYRRDMVVSLIMLGVMVVLLVVGYFVKKYWLALDEMWIMLALDVAAMVYMFVRAVMTWRRAYWWIALFILIATGYAFSTGYIFENVLKPHQQKRIQVVLGIVDDPRGVGYNTNQAQIAIGSGRFWGKGYLKGTQTRLKYVPEQHTDFIFCTIGEEWGFFGSMLLIAAYVVMMWRIVVISERAEAKFVRAYGYGLLGIFIFHFVVNIGMVLGIMPVIGIPLPLVSYGGSSFLSFTIMLAILLKLDTMREERLR